MVIALNYKILTIVIFLMLFLVPFTSAADGDFKVPEVTKDIE